MYTEKFRYGTSAYAGKRSSGGPIKPRGCIGTRYTPLATSLLMSCLVTNLCDAFVLGVDEIRAILLN